MDPRGDYVDFEIELQSIGQNQFRAKVLDAPTGKPETAVPFPFVPEELDTVLGQIEAQIRKSALMYRDARRVRETVTASDAFDPSDFGRRLFQALFPPEIEAQFRTSLAHLDGAATAGTRRGLRLRLTLRKTDDLDAFGLIAACPWEFLLDGSQILAIHSRTTVVRSIGARSATKPVEVDPLRILLVNSQPTDLQPLRTDQEEVDVVAALEANKNFEAVPLNQINLRTLRNRLEAGGFHVLHFMGHGEVLKGSRKESVLYFEGDDRRSEPITGAMLGQFLLGLEDLRLVVINACWSAAFDRKGGQDPFTGVALALIDQGIPAVVAMQQPISDRAALCFSNTFYERLAAGYSPGAAITQARLDLWGQDPQGVEWGTPVLFLKGDDHVFEIPSGDRARVPVRAEVIPTSPSVPASASVPALPMPKAPLFLRIQSFNPAHFAGEETLHALLDLTRFFEGPNNRFCRRPELWQSEIFPRLREFLAPFAAMRCPLVFDFATHMTVAFAAGYCLEAKSGLDIRLLQRSQTGVGVWTPEGAEAGPSRAGQLWLQEPNQAGIPGASDVALALEVTWPIADQVQQYIKTEVPTVGRILPLTLYPKPSNTGVADGLHALQLAQSVAHTVRKRSFEERKRTLHLFASAPYSLLFFLGQLGASLGTVQLYEHDFREERHKTYEPSLILPSP